MRALLLPLVLLGCTASPEAVDRDAVHTGERLAARLVREPHDPARHLDTCKVFHHVFAPDGRLLTKGIGGDYEHHRGLFLGFNQVACGGRRWDFWHCRQGETQQCVDLVDGADLHLEGTGWQVAVIAWRDGNGQAIVRERRALRARALAPDVTVLDLVTELVATTSLVRLTGDPQHSGQQFRALQQFAEAGAEPVRYLRPANAQGGDDDIWRGCAWIAAVLPLPAGPVTVIRAEMAGNPLPVLWSTRPYGRFGATFTHDLQPGTPLRLRHRYVIALGERDAAWCDAAVRSPQH
ncbi:MAG: PmoA family protein [Planctomycetes bacterium]|nr:PmoA family protein [Planctomycetota bacterium]